MIYGERRTHANQHKHIYRILVTRDFEYETRSPLSAISIILAGNSNYLSRKSFQAICWRVFDRFYWGVEFQMVSNIKCGRNEPNNSAAPPTSGKWAMYSVPFVCQYWIEKSPFKWRSMPLQACSKPQQGNHTNKPIAVVFVANNQCAIITFYVCHRIVSDSFACILTTDMPT